MTKFSETWSYNPHRATLLKDGKFFAFVTPDGNNALEKEDERRLVERLNVCEAFAEMMTDSHGGFEKDPAEIRRKGQEFIEAWLKKVGHGKEAE